MLWNETCVMEWKGEQWCKFYCRSEDVVRHTHKGIANSHINLVVKTQSLNFQVCVLVTWNIDILLYGGPFAFTDLASSKPHVPKLGNETIVWVSSSAWVCFPPSVSTKPQKTGFLFLSLKNGSHWETLTT